MFIIDGNDNNARMRQKINSNFTRLGGLLVTGEPTGFTTGLDDDNMSIGVSYDSTTRKVTLTGTFEAYYNGVQITALTDGWVSPAHGTTLDVTYYLRYDGTQFLFDTTPWSFADMMIASVQYGTNDKICLREVHGLVMSSADHKAWHNNYGTTRRLNGTIFSNIVAGSTTPADRRPYVNGVILQDEDLATEVTDLTTNSYTQRKLTGSSSTGTKAYVTAQTDIVKLSGSQPYYNEWTGSVWQDTLFPNNHYGAIFVVATPTSDDAGSQPYRLLWVQPQQTSLNLEDIEALTPVNLVHGIATSLLNEYNFIGKIIIQYTAGDWKITSYEALFGNRQTQVAGQMVYGLATDTADGLMSSEDFTKLGTYPTVGTSDDNKFLTVNTSDQLGFEDIGALINRLAQLISTTVDSADEFVISDAGEAKRLTLNSLGLYLFRTEDVTVTRNTTNTTSNSTYTCLAFPALRLVYFRGYYQINTSLAASTRHDIATVDTNYAPTVTHALSASRGNTSAAVLNADINGGTKVIGLISTASLANPNATYITGVWNY